MTYFGSGKRVDSVTVSGSLENSSSNDTTNHAGCTGGVPSPSDQTMCDFVFPTQSKQQPSQEDDREFYIRFDQASKRFFVKDMGRGYGVFQEISEPVPLRDNTLVNIGEAYIVSNVEQKTLKLRVFSAPERGENPDKYQCAHIDQRLVVGRSPNCDIRIEDELLSKAQGEIYFDPSVGSWVLSDGFNGNVSTNGTWVYVSEEQPIVTGTMLKSNNTFLLATILQS